MLKWPLLLLLLPKRVGIILFPTPTDSQGKISLISPNHMPAEVVSKGAERKLESKVKIAI